MIGAKFWILILSAAALLIVFSQGVFSLCESGCNPIPSCSFSCTADGCCGDWQYYCFGDGLYKKRECCFNSSSGLSYFQVAFVQWCANGCSNGECNEEEPECVLDSDCGTNGYVGQEYCQNNNVYQDYKSFTCSNNTCSSSTEKKLKENCKNGCLNGQCIVPEPECCTDSDCGTDYYGENYCKNDDVYNNFHDFKCINSICSEGISEIFHQDCGTDSCIEWQNYCIGNELWRKRTCNDKGCLNGACFSNSNAEVAKIKTCENGCANGACIIPVPECTKNSDCGTNGYIGDEYCYSGDVYQDYKSFTCSNNTCSSSTEKKLKENCEDGCSNGECNEENKKDEECSDTTKAAEEELCGNGYCDVDVGEDESNCPEDCLKTLSQTQSYSSNTIYQLSHSDSADVKEDSVKQNPAVNSQMFVPAILLALTAILIIILAVVLIAG